MRFITAFISIAALAACSGSASDETAEDKLGVGAGIASSEPAAPPPAAMPEPARTALEGSAALQSAGAASASSALQIAGALPDSLRAAMLIRTGYARIEVESLEAAIAAVRQLAGRLGGQVAGVAMQTGADQIREATLTLRIPATRFDEAVFQLEPLGDVESVNVTSEDVGEEYVDVGIRLENGRRIERRLLQLLETRTGRLEEVLAVERELARVREEIERFEGRLRYLRNRATVSTLTITLHEPVPLLSDYQGQNVVLRSFGRAWRNFVNLVAGLIASMGIVIPLALVLVLVWIFVRRRQ